MPPRSAGSDTGHDAHQGFGCRARLPSPRPVRPRFQTAFRCIGQADTPTAWVATGGSQMARRPAEDADVVVVTALDLEYDAVRAHLTEASPHTDRRGTRYEIGRLRGSTCR